jgi:hypothetical protein
MCSSTLGGLKPPLEPRFPFEPEALNREISSDRRMPISTKRRSIKFSTGGFTVSKTQVHKVLMGLPRES